MFNSVREVADVCYFKVAPSFLMSLKEIFFKVMPTAELPFSLSNSIFGATLEFSGGTNTIKCDL